jgi:3-isopropylmalate/(R)-2-methylmalate dehydratase small subunit
MTDTSKISRIRGRAVAIPGDDIDTDRIIPARYLKAITFDGLGDHLFEDERREATRRGLVHPLDAPAHAGASVLLVRENFGCGSSREHAPQAIVRWGIRAVVGESFAEIFFGNSLMLGLPCVSVSRPDLDRLFAAAAADPNLEFDVNVSDNRVTAGTLQVPMAMPEAVRASLLSGAWDATTQLLDRYDEVEAVAAALPYLSNWPPR